MQAKLVNIDTAEISFRSKEDKEKYDNIDYNELINYFLNEEYCNCHPDDALEIADSYKKILMSNNRWDRQLQIYYERIKEGYEFARHSILKRLESDSIE